MNNFLWLKIVYSQTFEIQQTTIIHDVATNRKFSFYNFDFGKMSEWMD